MVQNGFGKTFEQIASSFIGNPSEMSAAGPEQMPQTSGEVIQEHRNEIRISIDQYAPEAIGRMIAEQAGREEQMTGITTRSDVIGLGAGVRYDRPLTIDGDPYLLEQVLRGERSSMSLLNGDVSEQDIVYKNDQLHQQVVASREADTIESLRQRVEEAAATSMQADNTQFATAA